MSKPVALLMLSLAVAAGCRTERAKPVRSANAKPGVALLAQLQLPVVKLTQPDGEADGPVVVGPNLRALSTAVRASVVALESPPKTSHPLVCDILGFGGALYISHAVVTIGKPGARIHRYELATAAPKRWSLAFDWDRLDAKPDFIGGRGGEGISRLRFIDGRIYAADSDTPGPGGYGRSKARYEDYLFVSDRKGVFGPLEPGLTPPATSKVLPLSFHVFDVIEYHGALVASGGSGLYPTGPYPGALWVGTTTDTLLPVRFELGPRLGVVRTTFMHRFGGRLYIGFQNNWQRGGRPVKFDLAVLTGNPRDKSIPAPLIARVTPRGGWLTRRFASSSGVLYWVASRYDKGTAALFESTDGKKFQRVDLPGDPGDVQDIAVVGDTRYVLSSNAVYRSDGRKPFKVLATIASPSPFAGDDLFCSAPLVAYGDRLFAGSSVDGKVYEIKP